MPRSAFLLVLTPLLSSSLCAQTWVRKLIQYADYYDGITLPDGDLLMVGREDAWYVGRLDRYQPSGILEAARQLPIFFFPYRVQLDSEGTWMAA